MAISTPTIAVETGSTSNATSYATATFNPVAGALLVVVASVSDADDPGTMNISSDIGTMGVWTEVDNFPWNVIATPLLRTKVWWGIVGSTPGTAKAITISGMPDACTGANIIVVSVASGYNSTTPIVQHPGGGNDTVQASITHTFAAFTGSANLGLSFIAMTLATAGPTVDAGWTALGAAISYASPTVRAHVAYQENASDTTAVWSWTTSGKTSLAGLEIATSDASVTPSTVAAVAAVPAPTISAGATVSGTTVAAIGAVPAVTVTTGGALDASPAPATVAAIASVPAPTIAAGATASPSTVVAITAVPAPTIAAGAIVSVSTVAVIGAVPASIVSAGAAVSPSTVTASVSVPAPTITTGGVADTTFILFSPVGL